MATRVTALKYEALDPDVRRVLNLALARCECGGKPELVMSFRDQKYSVGCVECGKLTSLSGCDDPIDLVKAWNHARRYTVSE